VKVEKAEAPVDCLSRPSLPSKGEIGKEKNEKGWGGGVRPGRIWCLGNGARG